MHLYLSSAPAHPKQLSHILDTVANLYRLNVLADASKVFARVGEFDSQVWALTERSACIQYLLANKPGCARITQERIRWAPTTDGSQENPQLEINFDDLPKDSAGSFTLVVEHCDPEKTVSIIEKSSKKENGEGTYKSTETGVHVIDTSIYRGASLVWRDEEGNESYTQTPGASSYFPDINEYESAHAMVYGIQYMTQNMTKAEAQAVRKNPELYRLKFTHEDMQTLVKGSYGALNSISQGIMRKLRENEIESISAR